MWEMSERIISSTIANRSHTSYFMQVHISFNLPPLILEKDRKAEIQLYPSN